MKSAMTASAFALLLILQLTTASAQDPALVSKAQAGDPAAQDTLGDFFYAKDTPQDYTQAASWYRKAADQGYSKAQYSLGVSYCWREGVPQDYEQAYFWIDLAIEGKVEDSNHWLNFAASHLTQAEIDQAQQRARSWLQSHPEKAAAQ